MNTKLEQQEVTDPVYDMIIVGGGPGGYTAALYAARAGLKAVVLEKLSAGGQMALTEQIDNYPGFEEGIDGFTLGEKMRKGAERFGVETRLTEVLALSLEGETKKVEISEGTLYGRTVVLATGASPRELGVAEEKELVGRGVNYCAACDGMFYKGKTVVLVGGGNSAAADALILSRIAEKVILVHRRDTLRATKIYHEPLMQAENVEFRWNSTVTEILHDETVKGVRLRDVKTGEESLAECDGVFISVGRKPATDLVKGQIELDSAGYVAADESTKTNIPGVFAVGDVRTKALRQVVTAVADGAVAVHYAEEYLAGGSGGISVEGYCSDST
ncbi:MAG: thioredoxin-disulfide reductase [Eubacteriales bacterium]|nr:thioredoxin-disulfide reductase [Eubacteriales bacterium]